MSFARALRAAFSDDLVVANQHRANRRVWTTPTERILRQSKRSCHVSQCRGSFTRQKKRLEDTASSSRFARRLCLLPSGLYRRLWFLTRSASRLGGSRASGPQSATGAPLPVTAGQDLAAETASPFPEGLQTIRFCSCYTLPLVQGNHFLVMRSQIVRSRSNQSVV